MNTTMPRLRKDREEIIGKFQSLARAAAGLHEAGTAGAPLGIEKLVGLRAIRVSALNLLARVASPSSVYYRELADAQFTDHLALGGIIQAALDDYQQGYVADNTLLISGEVFSDLLVQSEVLLDHGYKDAAAVLIRAVLEDGLRRIGGAAGVSIEPREMMGGLNDKLYRAGVYSLLEQKEITAKAQIGNDAAHGHFDRYQDADVRAFLTYVHRFLAEQLR